MGASGTRRLDLTADEYAARVEGSNATTFDIMHRCRVIIDGTGSAGRCEVKYKSLGMIKYLQTVDAVSY